MGIKNKFARSIAACIAHAVEMDQEEVFRLLEVPKNKEFGELCFPCFGLAKTWRLAPPACAERLAQSIKPPAGLSIKTVGAFLNFRLERDSFTATVVQHVLLQQHSASARPASIGKTVVIDYSSPNIAKPFHVGHLRATLIGNCLYRVYRHLGYNTIGVNHLGDWGTQFGFVWAGCELWGKPAEATVKALVELYRRATTLKDQQAKIIAADPAAVLPDNLPNVNEMARKYFLDLEAGEQYAVDFWKWCSEISLIYLRQTYDRLGIFFDYYTGESFYSDKIEAVQKELEAAGILQESEGALGVELGENGGFARIFSADGRSLYLTRDLATAKYRAETFNFDRALYVVGTPQSLHFQQLQGVLRRLGHHYAEKIEHVSFGHVAGMKTRGGGEVIELNDFLDEANERSLEAYHTQVGKRPAGLDEHAVAEAVALSAIVFSNLSRSRVKDVHFSWEHALEFQGDSGPYLLYAQARINGIRDKAAEAGIAPSSTIDPALLPEESAFQLALLLDEFDSVIERTIAENEPAHIAAYALDISKAFSRAYNELQVLGAPPKVASARLSLFDTTRTILREAISLLGFRPLDRM